MTESQIFYKYRSWQENVKIKEKNKFEKRLLTKREFYISSAKQFNDPYDLRIPKRYDLMSKDQFFRTSLFYLGNLRPHDEFINIFSAAKKNTNERFNNPDCKLDLKKEIEDFIKTHGVYCFSERPTNIISWTFYGNNHSGYCVGFDWSLLRNYLITNFSKDIGISKVHYTDDIPELIPDMDHYIRFDNIIKRLTTKYIDWSFENEWRLIFLNLSEKLIELPKEIFKEVYLGCNTSDKTKDEIKNTLVKTYDSKVDLYELNTNMIDYNLELKKIDY